MGSKKAVLGIFKILLRLRDRQVSMRQSLEILNVFNNLTLNQIFRNTQTLGIKIDNAIFPYKTAFSEVNFETNRMGITKLI